MMTKTDSGSSGVLGTIFLGGGGAVGFQRICAPIL
jgi:hypothetical protein